MTGIKFGCTNIYRPELCTRGRILSKSEMMCSVTPCIINVSSHPLESCLKCLHTRIGRTQNISKLLSKLKKT